MPSLPYSGMIQNDGTDNIIQKHPALQAINEKNSFQKQAGGSSCCGSVVTNLASIHEDVGSISILLSRLRFQHCHSCDVRRRCNSDPTLLWLWHRPAAMAPIWPLAWELPYASGVTLKKAKKKKSPKYYLNESLCTEAEQKDQFQQWNFTLQITFK